jgi:hypothetical protein
MTTMLLVTDNMMGEDKFFLDTDSGYAEALAYVDEVDKGYEKVVWHKEIPGEVLTRYDGSSYHEVDYDNPSDTQIDDTWVDCSFDGEQFYSVRIERVRAYVSSNEVVWWRHRDEQEDEEEEEEEKMDEKEDDETDEEDERDPAASLLMVNLFPVDAENPIYFKDDAEGKERAVRAIGLLRGQYADAEVDKLCIERITPGCKLFEDGQSRVVWRSEPE